MPTLTTSWITICTGRKIREGMAAGRTAGLEEGERQFDFGG